MCARACVERDREREKKARIHARYVNEIKWLYVPIWLPSHSYDDIKFISLSLLLYFCCFPSLSLPEYALKCLCLCISQRSKDVCDNWLTDRQVGVRKRTNDRASLSPTLRASKENSNSKNELITCSKASDINCYLEIRSGEHQEKKYCISYSGRQNGNAHQSVNQIDHGLRSISFFILFFIFNILSLFIIYF